MKRILLICTGGTIASGETASGLAPVLTGDVLLAAVPAVKGLCAVDCVQPFAIDSTDMTPGRWLELTETIRAGYETYDGFVVCHGTDTMAYTAAALSYLVQGGDKPVVLTGGQNPIDAPGSDAVGNLLDAFTVAVDGRAPGVSVVFAGDAISGTHVRKVRTHSDRAFISVNAPLLGRVVDGGYRPEKTERTGGGPVCFSDKLDEKVFLMKLTPGAQADQLAFLLERGDGVVLEGYGLGGVPGGPDGPFCEALRRGAAAGRLVAACTQVPFEGTDLSVYSVGQRLLGIPGVVECGTMTPEAAVCKLMWALGQSEDRDKALRLFKAPAAGDAG